MRRAMSEFEVQSGNDMLALSSSQFDPIRTFVDITGAFLSYAIASILGVAAFATPGCSYSIIGFRPIQRENAVSRRAAAIVPPSDVGFRGQNAKKLT
jgi:hypothetical protein